MYYLFLNIYIREKKLYSRMLTFWVVQLAVIKFLAHVFQCAYSELVLLV